MYKIKEFYYEMGGKYESIQDVLDKFINKNGHELVSFLQEISTYGSGNIKWIVIYKE